MITCKAISKRRAGSCMACSRSNYGIVNKIVITSTIERDRFELRLCHDCKKEMAEALRKGV